ncbi:hypothetical protein [Aquimarina pacifica]|uniref:hypothetical protein n=1 Tax=Aquimarina pacifica TaxID=1296415 RepID=UPI000472C658|nr:hypothetical protein [Aquimarina pacifica]
MNAIDKIYSNELGISFYWKQEKKDKIPRIQVVFRDVGFLLTLNELKDFSDACLVTIRTQGCGQCAQSKHCRSLLLRTPSDKVDMAVSRQELDQIQELIVGTIFRIELNYWVKNVSFN